MIVFTVTDNGEGKPPTCHTRTDTHTYAEVRAALERAVKNLQGRLDNTHECPLSPEDS